MGMRNNHTGEETWARGLCWALQDPGGPVRQGLLMGGDEKMRELVSGGLHDQKSLCAGLS